MIDEPGAILDLSNNSTMTPLYIMAESATYQEAMFELMTYLVDEKKVSLELGTSDGKTPLMNAESKEIADFLLSRGAQPNARWKFLNSLILAMF